MSWASDKVYNSGCEEVFAYDTAQPRDGAPGLPGEERLCYGELESGELVIQKRRLVRNATGANLLAGEGCELASGQIEVIDAKSPANMPAVRFAGVVPEKVNENRYAAAGLGTQGIVPTAAWFWAVVGGKCDFIADAALVVDTPLICEAATGAGRVDDTAVAGLEHCIVGKAIEAAGAPGAKFEGLCTVSW